MASSHKLAELHQFVYALSINGNPRVASIGAGTPPDVCRSYIAEVGSDTDLWRSLSRLRTEQLLQLTEKVRASLWDDIHAILRATDFWWACDTTDVLEFRAWKPGLVPEPVLAMIFPSTSFLSTGDSDEDAIELNEQTVHLRLDAAAIARMAAGPAGATLERVLRAVDASDLLSVCMAARARHSAIEALDWITAEREAGG